MSRIGKQPIIIPEKVDINHRGHALTVKGPIGEIELDIHPSVVVEIKDKLINVSVKHRDVKEERALWGLFRALINNAVQGVVRGFEKKLEIHGVGFKASVAGQKLTLNLGLSHPIEYHIPEGITIKAEKGMITVFGANKQKVGEVAAEIRDFRPPEPYKGKGIKYLDEVIRRKAGKVMKAVGEAKG